MVEGGSNGFEIGDWGAGMGGGVDRDGHAGGVWGLDRSFFLVVQLGQESRLNERMFEYCVCEDDMEKG